MSRVKSLLIEYRFLKIIETDSVLTVVGGGSFQTQAAATLITDRIQVRSATQISAKHCWMRFLRLRTLRTVA